MRPAVEADPVTSDRADTAGGDRPGGGELLRRVAGPLRPRREVLAEVEKLTDRLVDPTLFTLAHAEIEPRPPVGVCQNLGGGENGGGVVLVVSR